MKKDFDVRGFLYEEVINECDKYKKVEEQIEYLQHVMAEWKFNKPRLDPNGDIKPRFGKRIEIQIEKRKAAIKLVPTTKRTINTKVDDDDLIWWKGTEPMMVYLFELLINTGLIDISQNEKRFSLIEKHFKKKNGGHFDNEQLGTAYQNMKNNKTGKPKENDTIKIESVLKEIRDYMKGM